MRCWKYQNLKKNKNSPYPIHLALGHEYISASVAKVRQPFDRFILTHRNIHFNISLSGKEYFVKLENETLGLKGGINNGNYGCMTMRNKLVGVTYTSSILANNLSIVLGISSALNKDGAAWIQTGDGAIEEGAFYEATVFAKARNLPIIILVENNNWSLGSSIKERRKTINLKRLSKSIGFDYYFSSKSKSIKSLTRIMLQARKKVNKTPQLIEIKVKTEGGKYSKFRGYETYHSGCRK